MKKIIYLIIAFWFIIINHEYAQDANIVNAFKGKLFEDGIMDKNMIFIRYYNNKESRQGFWYTLEMLSSDKAIKLLSLPPTNRACSLEVVVIPKGSIFLKGIAAEGYWVVKKENGKKIYKFINIDDWEAYKKENKDFSRSYYCHRKGGGLQIYTKNKLPLKNIVFEALNDGKVTLDYQTGIIKIRRKNGSVVIKKINIELFDKDDVLKKINNYLPSKMRSSDIEKASENFIKYFIESKKGKITGKELKVLLEDKEDLNNGLLDYWMRNISKNDNRILVYIFSLSLITSGEINGYQYDKVLKYINETKLLFFDITKTKLILDQEFVKTKLKELI